MSVTVGIDLVSVDEVRESLALHGEHYLQRVFTREELHDCGSNAERLAARFAAKEAAMKALGRGDEPLPWRSIAVRRQPNGDPALELSDQAAALAKQRGIKELAVSLTHEGQLAGAIVVAKGEDR